MSRAERFLQVLGRSLLVGAGSFVATVAVVVFAMRCVSLGTGPYLGAAAMAGCVSGLVGVRTHIQRQEFAAVIIKLVLAAVVGATFSWPWVRYGVIDAAVLACLGGNVCGPHSLAGVAVGAWVASLLLEVEQPPPKVREA